MTIDVKMPALSPTMEKGTLAKWLVSAGDVVAPGDILAEIETDKATMEFEAVDGGVIAELVVPEGTDDIPVGAVIARIGEAIAVTPAEVAPSPAEPGSRAPVLSPSARRAVRETGIDPAAVTGTGRDGRVTRSDIVSASEPIARARHTGPKREIQDDARISPLAHRLALVRKLDIAELAASAARGRILLSDLLPAKPAAPEPVSVAVSVAEPPAVPYERVKLSGMRRTIARRLTESKQQVPHIYLTVDTRIDALLALRAELNAALEPRGHKLSVNDLVIKAQALALLATPSCNVQFAKDELIRFSRADISVAVSLPDGIITPVIVDAAHLSLSTISAAMRDLAARARAGKLRPDEYQGGTASLSNLGMFGIRQFEAVINPPQAMILAVGEAGRRAVVDGDGISAATVMTVTGSFDHRAIDGADAAAFMQAFRALIEQPLQLIA